MTLSELIDSQWEVSYFDMCRLTLVFGKTFLVVSERFDWLLGWKSRVDVKLIRLFRVFYHVKRGSCHSWLIKSSNKLQLIADQKQWHLGCFLIFHLLFNKANSCDVNNLKFTRNWFSICFIYIKTTRTETSKRRPDTALNVSGLLFVSLSLSLSLSVSLSSFDKRRFTFHLCHHDMIWPFHRSQVFQQLHSF